MAAPIEMLFLHYGKIFSQHTVRQNTTLPFNEHPQLLLLTDILCRKRNHHLVLESKFSPSMQRAFLEAAITHFHQKNVPYALQKASLVYFNIAPLLCSINKSHALFTELQQLHLQLEKSDRLLLVAISYDPICFSKRHENIKNILHELKGHRHCRLLFFSTPHQKLKSFFAHDFSLISLSKPADTDITLLLKQGQEELQAYHEVVIPEELLTLAYSLSEHYLDANDPLDQALLLIDSSAARAAAQNRNDHAQSSPVLTINLLLSVLSHWTQIPTTHLLPYHFKHYEFTQGMQQRLFGQDAAITLIASAVQQAKAQLQSTTGPLCSFLFVGTAHTGKKTAAVALVEQLFQQLNILHFADTKTTVADISELQTTRSLDRMRVPLKEVVSNKPHAVIVFENIEQASPLVLSGLQEILTSGCLYGTNGPIFDFRQSILIMTTTVGANQLNVLAQPLTKQDQHQEVDLMQLVLGEQKPLPHIAMQQFSPEELAEEIVPAIQSSLPASIIEACTIVPFLPHNKNTIEHIIRLKIKILIQQIYDRYGIELIAAPEVIRYLVQEVLLRQEEDVEGRTECDRALKQLYFCVEQAILSQAENKYRTNQLFLQLNETGQRLRCDWQGLAATRQHTP